MYIIFGREVGAEGTPHLQGFVSFANRKRLIYVKRCLGDDTVHCEVSRQIPESIVYCKKDGDFEEFGACPVVQRPGRRTDLDAFREAVKSGTRKLSDLRELHSEVCAKYPRFVADYLDDTGPKILVTAHPLRPWQAALNQTLLLPPDARCITFIVDPAGNKGKSWFAHYYCGLHDNAMVLLPGRKLDMAFMLRSDIRVVFLDAPRSKQGEFVQYDFLEDIKNGYVASPKYESRFKVLGPCHVVVMMNEMPDMHKLSADRYNIVEV